MSRKVIVREGVNVRTLEYGSGSGDRMDLFIDEGETLLSGMASAHSCTVILTDASSGQDYIFAIWDKLAIGRCAPASGEDVRMVIYWDHQVSHLHATGWQGMICQEWKREGGSWRKSALN